MFYILQRKWFCHSKDPVEPAKKHLKDPFVDFVVYVVAYWVFL